MFYEIEYNSAPDPNTGKPAPKSKSKPQKIKKPEKDEIRVIFSQMRDIARAYYSPLNSSKYFEMLYSKSDGIIFRKQGLFMKDFTDDYAGSAEFSQYYPSYQMMRYEQFRTYFTWRTQVRQGNVGDISLFCAFLYIYELLGNIGVTDPQDGLDKLMFFWKTFRKHKPSIDIYLLNWLRDYHIYYELPHSFKEFVDKNGLTEHYPGLVESPDGFDMFCSISKYKIRKSAFFTDETSQMIADCFDFVMDRIRRDFEAAGMNFNNTFFRPAKKIIEWEPFNCALFDPQIKQPDKKIILSANEIYICKKNRWSFSTNITTEKGRLFISYVMKHMESTLRKVTNYKFKLTADTGIIHSDTIRVLTKAGLHIEKIVQDAVIEFHKESTKTVVTVDHTALARIRHEALITQEALIVEEQTQPEEVDPDLITDTKKETIPDWMQLTYRDQELLADISEETASPVSDVWKKLKVALSENERKALMIILKNGDIKAFADVCGVMTEVLIDGINEKAMDSVGDNLMDEEFVLYDEYKEQVNLNSQCKMVTTVLFNAMFCLLYPQ